MVAQGTSNALPMKSINLLSPDISFMCSPQTNLSFPDLFFPPEVQALGRQLGSHEHHLQEEMLTPPLAPEKEGLRGCSANHLRKGHPSWPQRLFFYKWCPSSEEIALLMFYLVILLKRLSGKKCPEWLADCNTFKKQKTKQKQHSCVMLKMWESSWMPYKNGLSAKASWDVNPVFENLPIDKARFKNRISKVQK